MIAKEDTNKGTAKRQINNKRPSKSESFDEVNVNNQDNKTSKLNIQTTSNIQQSSTKRRKAKKIQKLLMKKKAKFMEKKAEKELDVLLNERQKDTFVFGEVVHHPPDITVRPRKVAVSNFANRVSYQTLILHFRNYYFFFLKLIFNNSPID